MTPFQPSPRAPGQQPDGVRPARPGRGFGDLLDPVDFVNGQLTHEYNGMAADIARTPRPTLWQRFTMALAGQSRPFSKRKADV